MWCVLLTPPPRPPIMLLSFKSEHKLFIGPGGLQWDWNTVVWQIVRAVVYYVPQPSQHIMEGWHWQEQITKPTHNFGPRDNEMEKNTRLSIRRVYLFKRIVSALYSSSSCNKIFAEKLILWYAHWVTTVYLDISSKPLCTNEIFHAWKPYKQEAGSWAEFLSGISAPWPWYYARTFIYNGNILSV